MLKQKLPDSINRWRLIVLSAYYGLLILFLFNSLLITTKVGATTIVIWMIQILPLLIFITALHRKYLRAYAWLSFVVLIYFVHGVLTAFNQEKFYLGVIETLLCSLLFTALVIYIRKYRNHYNVTL